MHLLRRRSGTASNCSNGDRTINSHTLLRDKRLHVIDFPVCIVIIACDSNLICAFARATRGCICRARPCAANINVDNHILRVEESLRITPTGWERCRCPGPSAWVRRLVHEIWRDVLPLKSGWTREPKMQFGPRGNTNREEPHLDTIIRPIHSINSTTIMGKCGSKRGLRSLFLNATSTISGDLEVDFCLGARFVEGQRLLTSKE
jgi:hypothetical protein